jgi:hypothetical protein
MFVVIFLIRRSNPSHSLSTTTLTKRYPFFIVEGQKQQQQQHTFQGSLIPNMRVAQFSPSMGLFPLKTIVQPTVASTHLPAYNIIGAAPRPRYIEADESLKVSPRRSHFSSLYSSRSSRNSITRENLSKVSLSCAREQDLDAPLSPPSSAATAAAEKEPRRTMSQSSLSSCVSASDLPSINEEEEEEELAVDRLGTGMQK